MGKTFRLFQLTFGANCSTQAWQQESIKPADGENKILQESCEDCAISRVFTVEDILQVSLQHAKPMIC